MSTALQTPSLLSLLSGGSQTHTCTVLNCTASALLPSLSQSVWHRSPTSGLREDAEWKCRTLFKAETDWELRLVWFLTQLGATGVVFLLSKSLVFSVSLPDQSLFICSQGLEFPGLREPLSRERNRIQKHSSIARGHAFPGTA